MNEFKEDKRVIKDLLYLDSRISSLIKEAIQEGVFRGRYNPGDLKESIIYAINDVLRL